MRGMSARNSPADAERSQTPPHPSGCAAHLLPQGEKDSLFHPDSREKPQPHQSPDLFHPQKTRLTSNQPHTARVPSQGRAAWPATWCAAGVEKRGQGRGGYPSGPGLLSQAGPARQGRCGKALNTATRRKLLKTLHAERQPSSKRYYSVLPGEGPALRPPFHHRGRLARGACACPSGPGANASPRNPRIRSLFPCEFLYKHRMGTA